VWSSGRNNTLPHLIDVRREGDSESVPGYRTTSLKTGGTEGKVGLDLVPAVVQLLEDVIERDDYAGDSAPAEHADDRDW
jgi:hypothetical protein